MLPVLSNQSESDVHMALMCFKHKLRSQMCTGALADSADPSGLAQALAGGGAAATSGLLFSDFQPSAAADLDFFVDGGMIHVADTKVDRRFSEYFIRQVEMLQQFEGKVDRKEFVM
ncbi:unnamed protein product [Protopolystoma xenopodis]|uniref:Uncharacterized protein n=1 Tax=Protopolystoma xenopodis TaxID=117903 RepID=A0A448WLB5_9PLAT|nr:unnamed protein product [Protopolystoma xenopodis]